MRIELLKKPDIGKHFLGVIADTPKGLNDEATIVWMPIVEEAYNAILQRVDDQKSFKVLQNNIPSGLWTTITEIYKK